MKKIILIDGHNFMFRSFYGTFYSGSIMRNEEGFPTNALYGFVKMLNKIIEEEKPEYMLVAFDKGENFRKKKYSFYKEGRTETPKELLEQFPYAKKILDGMGIKYLEFEPYEADDIIGSIVKMAEADPDFDTTIISSDMDLLQLINFETDVKLLKQKDYIRYNLDKFKEDYGMDPINMIDLKALMGDSSDNIPGVKGVGEKTALKLLSEYKTLNNIYENIDNIKGTLKDKLIKDKENAYISYELATIKTDVPLNLTFQDMLYLGENDQLKDIYQYLGFKSLMSKKELIKPAKYKKIENLDDLILEKDVSLYIETDNENYHLANVLGISVKDDKNSYFINKNLLNNLNKFLLNYNVSTYDIKKHKKFLPNLNFVEDLMIYKFLNNYQTKEDITSIMDNNVGIDFKTLKKEKFDETLIETSVISKTTFIHNEIKNIKSDQTDLYKLYKNIEVPLASVLLNMENEGMKCEVETLNQIGIELNKELNNITETIHNLAGEEFNISSPKQLGEILFEKLKLPGAKKNKTGYQTGVSILEKIVNEHEIINYVLQYRHLSKLTSTYVEGLINYVFEDGIIRPIYKQTLARTGRLTCTEPNLQNIPIRDELGRTIRKAFVPKNDLFLSFDYSQIELRILAHISNDDGLIKAYNENKDIHRSVASDIYEIPESEITAELRETAKAVIFGIVYGISGFGLGQNLKISPKEANDFINKYYIHYPKVKIYMDEIIKSANETKEVKTLFGRTRIIEELSSNNYMVRKMGERMALNTPIQGTSADIIKKAMVLIDKYLTDNNLKSKLILQIHDELVFDVIEEEQEKLIKDITNIMESVIKLKVPLKVDYKTGKTWYDA